MIPEDKPKKKLSSLLFSFLMNRTIIDPNVVIKYVNKVANSVCKIKCIKSPILKYENMGDFVRKYNNKYKKNSVVRCFIFLLLVIHPIL